MNSSSFENNITNKLFPHESYIYIYIYIYIYANIKHPPKYDRTWNQIKIKTLNYLISFNLTDIF